MEQYPAERSLVPHTRRAICGQHQQNYFKKRHIPPLPPIWLPSLCGGPRHCRWQKNPKMDTHSRVGIYLGRNCDHADSVAWILNPHTDHISAQFYTIFDDTFST
eukprot:12855196-Ditylum_brightwellii.AAC.1